MIVRQSRAPGGAEAPRRAATRGETSDAAFSFSRTCIPTGVGAEGTGTCGTASPTKSAIPGSPARCRAPAGRRAPATRGEQCAQTPRRARGSAGSCRTRSRSSAGGSECGARRRRRNPPAPDGATPSPRPRTETRAGRFSFPAAPLGTRGGRKKDEHAGGAGGARSPRLPVQTRPPGRRRSASAGTPTREEGGRTRGGRSSCG